MRGRWLLAGVAALAVAAAACADDGDGDADAAVSERSERGAQVATPTVTGPVEGGAYDMPHNPAPPEILEPHDYAEEEFVVSGTATSYRPASPNGPEEGLGSDGEWEVTDADVADYTTRIIVRRPVEADAFDGTVVVEWLNVSAGMDADPDWGFAHEELMRRGAAYVGVSAQLVGVEGGEEVVDVPGVDIVALKEWDPERYEVLTHPGDEYSYDIFSQAAQALLRPDGVDPLDGLQPSLLVATGQSQAAFHLVTYVNAIHPLADIYDGFMVHSRSAGSAPLADDVEAPDVVRARSNLSDPVMIFQTETDLLGLVAYFEARQPDTDMLVTWEVAGTAHADADTLEYGVASGRQWNPDERVDFEEMCGGPLNDGGQQYPLRAALATLIEWAAGGDPPAPGEPIETEIGPEGEERIARDEHGNTLGGVRTTLVDVPIATYSGEPRPDAIIFCALFGFTTPFTADQLAELYPTHDDYVAEVTEAADRLVDEGFLLAADRGILVAETEAADVP